MNNSTKMQTEQLTQIYVQAFLHLYYDTLKTINTDVLKKAHLYFNSRKNLYFLLESPLLDQAYKLKNLQQVRLALELPESFDNLINLLMQHKRTSLLQNLFAILDQEVKKRNNQISFVVSFVGQLTPEEKDSIQLFLEQATEKFVVCEYKQDPNLIAGIRLQSDQFLWEDSIKGRLDRIRCSLKR